MKISKTVIIGISISIATFLFLMSVIFIFDLHLHRKFDKIAGLNCRGYRGTVVGRRRPDEVRIGIFGGSVAMGYGVDNEKSIAGCLQALLDDEMKVKGLKKKYTVINLAATKESSCVYFKSAYSQFSYLDLDAMILYLWGESAYDKFLQVSYSERTGNWALRNFNYYFIFPTALREKYYLIRYGSISKGYEIDRFFDIIDTFSAQRWSVPGKAVTLAEFMQELTDKNKILILALSPSQGHDEPSGWLKVKRDFKSAFSGNSKIIMIDLEGIFSKKDAAFYLLDGIHYSEEGNRAIAETLLKYIPYHIYEK